MILRRKLELAIAIAAALVGCNALIDNEPGRLDESAAPSRAGTSDASTPDRGSSSQDDDSSASPISGTTNDDAGGTSPAPASGCSAGSKRCGDLCVSLADPLFGCAAPACTPCALPNATPACVNGACAPAICTPGFADCDAIPTNGCEADLNANASCGACGTVCKNGPHATGACTTGMCTLSCAADYGDCNHQIGDGCEKNLTHDKHNCGACGLECVFGDCRAGVCVW